MANNKRAQVRNQQRRNQQRGTTQRRGNSLTIVIGVVVVVLAVLLVVLVVNHGSKKAATPAVDPAVTREVVTTITHIPTSSYNSVGQGAYQGQPASAYNLHAISAPALTAAGKPRVVYIGSEYCPFCAAERWAVVSALSRFGTFNNLGLTHSSTSDNFPGTQTFTFHNATYSSPYLAFSSVELQGNTQQSNGSYPALETPTAEENQLLSTYDQPPYVASGGAIPFMDLGGKYVISGAQYSPQVLAGLSAPAIATDLKAGNPIGENILGTANSLTAAICQLTQNQPKAVCSTPVITTIEAQLATLHG